MQEKNVNDSGKRNLKKHLQWNLITTNSSGQGLFVRYNQNSI